MKFPSIEVIATIILGGLSLFFAILTYWESRKRRCPRRKLDLSQCLKTYLTMHETGCDDIETGTNNYLQNQYPTSPIGTHQMPYMFHKYWRTVKIGVVLEEEYNDFAKGPFNI